MRALYLASVWLHIVAAMTRIGGMLFLVTVLVPMLRVPAMRPRAAELFHAIGTRFRVVGWVALLAILATGVFNVTARGYRIGQLFDGEAFAGAWGHALAAKLALVAVIVVISLLHDFALAVVALAVTLVR